jgi:NAD-dependent deacetylase
MSQLTIPDSIASVLQRPFERIVVFSGAGMSAESGIATFRGAQDGLWARFNPAELATPSAWRTQRETVWAWYEARRAKVLAAEPNTGHRAVARLQQAGLATVVTQNVDDLHERAGAENVIHLHGSIMRGRCTACARPLALMAPEPETLQRTPPRCTHCGGWIRPAVVWFGESLPEDAVDEATRRISRADLLLVIGTSGAVQPAASLVNLAPKDCVVLEINPAADGNQAGRRWTWSAPAGQALPLLSDLLMG